jgi:hypothetical protein
MPFTTVYFREAETMIKTNRMKKNISTTLEDLDQSLATFHYRGFTVRSVLNDAGWREDTENLNIITGRRYQYKGYWKRIAIEANLNTYEFLWEGLFRLQVGFDRGKIDAGILILPGNRSDKSPLGNSIDLVKVEVEELFPTISLPVAVVLFAVDVLTMADEAIQEIPQASKTEIQPTAMEAAI